MGSRCEVTFRGRVQGVGFRFTTIAIARRYPIFGWVRNEPDGSVRVIAEGERSDLEAFLDSVRHEMSGNIADDDVRWSQPSGDFDHFAIRY